MRVRSDLAISSGDSERGVSIVQRILVYIAIFAAVLIYGFAVGATFWQTIGLLIASEGMLACTRLIGGEVPHFNDRTFPVLTMANVVWVFVSFWVAFFTILMGNLPLIATVYLLAFITIPEIILLSYSPRSEVYRELRSKRRQRTS